MYSLKNIVLVLCLFHLLNNANTFRGRYLPIQIKGQEGSPCPNIFEYRQDNKGQLYGLVNVDHSGETRIIQLDIELSVGNPVEGYNGKITLTNEKLKVIDDIMNQRPVLYNVHFPRWSGIPPRVTKILVNGKMVCQGSPIPINLVPVLTTINLQHKLRIDITPLISTSDPVPNRNGPPNFNSIRPEGPPGDPSLFFGGPPPDGPSPDGPGGRPPPPPPDFDIRRDNGQNFNPKNPYGFNPPSRNNQRPGQAFPGNPFLTGLSTATPQTNSDDNKNVFSLPFNPRTTESPPVVIQPITERSVSNLPGAFSSKPSSSLTCGRPLATNQLVVNGNSVPRGAYPWLVALFVIKITGLNYICSGSLISNRHIVTAAHCVKTDTKKYKPAELLCILGKLNIQRWVPTQGEKMLEPENVVIHPDYQPGSSDADIAVLILPENIEFNRFISPVCLWSGDDDLNQIVGENGTVLGWGKDETGEVSTAEPRQINLPIVNQEQCLRSGIQFQYITSNRTFCAGSRDGSGPCNGDSGSGFLMKKGDGRYELRGIVSIAVSESTRRSCDLSNYVVFTDASKFTSWLSSFLQ